MVETKKKKKKKNQPKEKQNWREWENIDLFVVDNLEKMGERGVNEVIKKKFIWKLRWKRKDESRWKVEWSETIEFKKI